MLRCKEVGAVAGIGGVINQHRRHVHLGLMKAHEQVPGAIQLVCGRIGVYSRGIACLNILYSMPSL